MSFIDSFILTKGCPVYNAILSAGDHRLCAKRCTGAREIGDGLFLVRSCLGLRSGSFSPLALDLFSRREPTSCA